MPCTACKKYKKDAPQLNYDNYLKYKFKSRSKFEKHRSTNKLCPAKSDKNLPNNNADVVVDWGPYIHNTSLISEKTHFLEQSKLNANIDIHNENGKDLWFTNSEVAALYILNEIRNTNTQWISLVAQPGSGKTMVKHKLIDYIMRLSSYEDSINPNSITITTGMSDNEWFEQMLNNLTLEHNNYLLEPIHDRQDNYCVCHRSNFKNRITYLLNNKQFISNHIFIIDECHFADGEDMTIDTELRRLGLTEALMIHFNIKVIFVSATPDVGLSLMERKDNHKQIRLINGDKYKGFKYYSDNGMIQDYNKILKNIDNLVKIINENWKTPRFHYIRARTQAEKGEYRIKYKKLCDKYDWKYIEDDSNNDCFISFENDLLEKTAKDNNKEIIRVYKKPNTHTIILIKNKYQASKRLRLTSFTGIISEKPSKKMNTTVTCNGLIPRFFGYYDLPNFENNEKPLFLCNKESVDQYINFTEMPDDQPWMYEGIDYTGTKIKTTPQKTKELKNTWAGVLTDTELLNERLDISIENFNTITEINNFIRSSLGIKKGGIELSKRDDYYLTSRLTNYYKKHSNKVLKELTKDDRLTYIKYYKDFGKKKTSFGCSNKTGQKYMVYPVYPNLDSKPDEVKFYIHFRTKSKK